MNKLHYFCTVVRSGSLIQASEVLRISQPAISKAIKALEIELNSKLIHPSGRGIEITHAGKKLFEMATPIIENFNNLKAGLDQELEIQKPFNIGSFEVFSTHFLGEVLGDIFPGRAINVHEYSPGELEEMIVQKIIDVGITYIPIPRAELDILKIKKIEMGIYGLNQNFTHMEFQDIPFVVPLGAPSSTPSKVKGLDGWPDHKIPRNIKYKVNMMETALELCRQGQCVGYFPKFLIELQNKKLLRKFQLKEITGPYQKLKNPQEIYLIKRKNDPESTEMKKLAKSMRIIC